MNFCTSQCNFIIHKTLETYRNCYVILLKTQAMIAVTWGYLVYGASIGFNAPVIHSLMQGNATNVYGGSMKLSFQQASWMCK